MLLRYYQKIDDALTYLISSSFNEKKFLKNFFLKKDIVLVDIGSNEGSYIDLVNKHFKIKKYIALNH